MEDRPAVGSLAAETPVVGSLVGGILQQGGKAEVLKPENLRGNNTGNELLSSLFVLTLRWIVAHRAWLSCLNHVDPPESGEVLQSRYVQCHEAQISHPCDLEMPGGLNTIRNAQNRPESPAVGSYVMTS